MAVDTLRPDADVSVTVWDTDVWSQIDDAIDDPTAGNITTSAEYVVAQTDGAEFEVSFPDLNIGTDDVVQVLGKVYGRAGTGGNLRVQLLTGSTTLGSPTDFANGNTAGWITATYTGDLTQTEVNDLRLRVTLTTAGSANSRVGVGYVTVEHEAGSGATFERSAAISASTAVTVAAREFFSIFSRSAAVAATSDVSVADYVREHLRATSIAAASAIEASGEFFTTFERSAAISAASAVTVSGEFETPAAAIERSASLSAATAVTVSHRRDLLRQAAISATSAVQASGESFTVHERSAAISATSGVAVADFEREHVRQASLSAATSIEVSGGVDGVAQRSASFEAASSVSVSGIRVHIRQASLSATTSLATQGTFWSTHERAAILSALTAIQATGIVNTTLERSVSIAATTLISVGGALNEPDLYPLDLTFQEAASMAFAESGPVSYRERASITHRS
jgi:hypothetical protein